MREERSHYTVLRLLCLCGMAGALAWISGCQPGEPTVASGKKPTPAPTKTVQKATKPTVPQQRMVFEAAQFQDVTGGRAEPEHFLVVLMTQNAGFTVPVSDLKPGPCDVEILAQNGKPAPVLFDIVNADEPDAAATSLAKLSFEAGDNQFTTVTGTIQLKKGTQNLRVRFVNDSPAGAEQDRNAIVQRVVLAPRAE